MHLLANENFPKPTVETLRAEGHDALWARTSGHISIVTRDGVQMVAARRK
jgi:hypothetical protein